MGALSGTAARMVGDLGQIHNSWGNDGKVHDNGKIQVLLFPEANSIQDRQREITGIYKKICAVTQGYDKLSIQDKQALAQEVKVIANDLKRLDSVEKRESPEMVREITNKLFEFAGGLEAKAANKQSPSPPKNVVVDNKAYLAQRAENLDAKTLQHFRDNAKENDYFLYKAPHGGYGLCFMHQGIPRDESVSVNKNGHLEIEGRTYLNFDKWRSEKEKISGRLGFRIVMKFEEEKMPEQKKEEPSKASAQQPMISKREMGKYLEEMKAMQKVSIGKLTEDNRKPFEQYVALNKNDNHYLIFENKELQFGILYPKDGKLVQADLKFSPKGLELEGKTYKDFEDLRTSLKLEGQFKKELLETPEKERLVSRREMRKYFAEIEAMKNVSVGKLTEDNRKPFEQYVAQNKNDNHYLIHEIEQLKFGIVYPKNGKLVQADLKFSAAGVELEGKTYKDFEDLRTSLKLEGPFKKELVKSEPLVSKREMRKYLEEMEALKKESVGKLSDKTQSLINKLFDKSKDSSQYAIFETGDLKYGLLYPKDGKLVQENLTISQNGVEMGGKTYKDMDDLRAQLGLKSTFY